MACYHQVISPATKNIEFFGYPEAFLEELCVAYVMYGGAGYHVNCGGFQMVRLNKASQDEDEIKEITHEEMDDVDIEEEGITYL